jgi:hypothetical protein
MARTALPIHRATPGTGLVLARTNAIADGHMFTNSGDTLLLVKNDDASSKTITIPTPREVQGLALADPTYVVPAGEEWRIGPFDPATFNQPSGADAGKVYVNYSAVTSVTVAVIEP